MLEVWVVIDACLACLDPVGGEGVIARLPPVVEYLVCDFRDQLRALILVVGRECGRDVGLGEDDAGVLEEDVDEAEDPGDEDADHDDNGDKAEPDEERLEANPHLGDQHRNAKPVSRKKRRRMRGRNGRR